MSDENATHDDKPAAGDPGNLHVVDSGGDGKPVVLIHGWPLTGDSWSAQLSALTEAGHRVITYDRRGFGQSGVGDGYAYDQLAGDLDNIINELDLHDVALVGFSMGGGEVARYAASFGTDRLRGVVFAAAIPPYLLKSDDNPDGPLEEDAYQQMRQGLEDDRDGFLAQFARDFYTAGDDLAVDQAQVDKAVELAGQSDQDAALGCMDAWATTDFRHDLESIDVPTLIIHGDSDGIVPLEGSAARTHEAIEGSTLVVIEGGPHGCNDSHPEEFNRALLDFLGD